MTQSATTLVAIQTLRGNAGIAAATTLVDTAVATYNAANGTDHVAVTFQALAPNTKGMQLHLSLWAVLARLHGATAIRLNVHNGMVSLCGTPAAVAATQSAFMPAYNATATLATASYDASYGNRMAFTNSFSCGVAGGIGFGTPAELAYGLGSLFTFPAPHPGHYQLGVTASQPIAELVAPNPATPAAPAPATRTRTRRVA